MLRPWALVSKAKTGHLSLAARHQEFSIDMVKAGVMNWMAWAFLEACSVPGRHPVIALSQTTRVARRHRRVAAVTISGYDSKCLSLPQAPTTRIIALHSLVKRVSPCIDEWRVHSRCIPGERPLGGHTHFWFRTVQHDTFECEVRHISAQWTSFRSRRKCLKL